MMWVISDPENPEVSKEYLGEAGNPSYPPDRQIQAVRYGDEVLVVCPCTRQEHIIPSDVIIRGFEGIRPDIRDGMTLKEAMEEGVVYNSLLLPVR